MSNEHRARELEIIKQLPRPPKQMRLCSDEEVVAWLQSCANISAEGVRAAFSAHLWPGSPQQRLAVWGRYAEMEKAAQARERAEDERRQEAMRDKAIAAERRQLKRIGWAHG
jgi:hypothetical protein